MRRGDAELVEWLLKAGASLREVPEDLVPFPSIGAFPIAYRPIAELLHQSDWHVQRISSFVRLLHQNQVAYQ